MLFGDVVCQAAPTNIEIAEERRTRKNRSQILFESGSHGDPLIPHRGRLIGEHPSAQVVDASQSQRSQARSGLTKQVRESPTFPQCFPPNSNCTVISDDENLVGQH